MLDPHITPDQYADAYLHQLLSDEEIVAFAARCKEDERFRRALVEARRRQEFLVSVPSNEASEKLIRKTLDRINGEPADPLPKLNIYSRAVLAVSAAAAIMIAAFHVYFANLRPTPYDVRILGQSRLLSGTEAAIRVLVSNERSGERLHGVPVAISIVDQKAGHKVDLASFKTGEESAGNLQLPDWADGDYQLHVVAYPDGSEERLTRSLRLTRQWKLMLSTDKPVYQPGQTIHLRSLALRKPDLRPVVDQAVVFTIADPKGNVIFKHRARGSRFGIAAADCALATEITEGPYLVECRIGDTVSEKTVRIEKYVLPKFSVVITLDKPFYQPGEPVEGTLQADYFFGQAVASGRVNIEVRSGDVQPQSLASILEKTDDRGRAAFRFQLPDKLFGDEQHGGDAEFSLAATVTDSAGQTHSHRVKRVVTTRPIQLEVIPESGQLVHGIKNKVYIFANYADGRPAKVVIKFNGTSDQVETNRLGVAEMEVHPVSDSLGMTLVAQDNQGRIGRKHIELTVGHVTGDFIVRTDKASYAGGETMTLTALGGGIEPVFVDLLKDGQTILTTMVDMASGKGAHQFDLPPEVFGTMKLVAYRFGEAGLPVRKTKLIYVRQAQRLQIATGFDKDVYRPGDFATLQLKLTDRDGRPVPGAVSLAAVDEAVFSVLGQRPGMEQAFFLLGEELLEPVYAAYHWDPFGQDGVPAEDVNRWEQALFSRVSNARRDPHAQLRQIIEQYAEGDLRLLEVLEAPDLDELMESAWVPDELKRLIHADSPHSLTARSFPAKKREVTQRRRASLQIVHFAWGCLAVFIVASAVIWMLCHVRYFAEFLVVAFLFLLVAALLMPAVQSAREASRRNSRLSDLRQLGLAVEGAAASEGAAPETTPSEADGTPRPHVRQWFPETLLWRPEMITDDKGEATLEIPLADSITTWRLTASAVSAEGQLGGAQFPIPVFQPFFVDLDLPVALTRNDQVSVPVVVYNYLDQPQDVVVTLADADWFTRLDAAGAEAASSEPLTLELGPREIRAVHFPLRVKQVGQHFLQVTAVGSGISDAMKRQIEVVPDGRRIEQIVSGSLSEPAQLTLSLPADHIDSSAQAFVKLYPSKFSQLVEGLDNIFRMPSGCFEQTSSTTYPNVLALDYLRRTKTSAPNVEARARQFIHTGYQRLISFEVDGGGFDWFGNPPANRTLTAYGLMEFEDMARLHDVDPRLIERTRSWLLSQRQADGRWEAELHMLSDGLAGSVNRRENADLAATAYIAWAVFGSGEAKAQARVTLDYLLAHEPASIKSPYLLAIIANCIAGIDPNHSALSEYLTRLEAMKENDAEGKQNFWTQSLGEQTMFYGAGRSGDIETTAMAILALMKSGQYSSTVKKALTWLIAQKDGSGTWYSTQATVLALKALVEATGSSLGGDEARRIDLALDGKVIRTVDIPADQSEVMQWIDVSGLLATGDQQLTITDRTGTGTDYQVAFFYHVGDEETLKSGPSEPLSIDVVYDRERLKVDEQVTATATVSNNSQTSAPMIIVDLPIPAGFKIEVSDLDELVSSQKIAKYQITARKTVVYLRGLQPSQQLTLIYRLKATMPVKVSVPPAMAYEYYTPEKRGIGKSARLEVAPDA